MNVHTQWYLSTDHHSDVVALKTEKVAEKPEKYSKMSADENAKAQASKILGLSKETELLHSFVRIDLGANDEKEKDPRSGHRPLHIPKQTSLEIGGDTDKDRGHSPRHKPISGKAIFKQIKKEMKNKGNRRRRVRREEEVYTDKDRAAAVNMGSKDIKSSLNAKLRQDKTKALSLPDEADPGTLLALGRNELRTGNFNIAIGFVNKVFYRFFFGIRHNEVENK